MARLPHITPKMPKTELEGLISELKEIKRVASMKGADFGVAGRDVKSNENCTDFIRERTNLWRNSWIISPLEVLIERYEEALKNQSK